MTEAQKVRRTLNWLVRPILVSCIGLTLYGNVSQAQPSIGGWISHAWAPALYLVLVEILVRRAVGGLWLPWVVGLFLILTLVAGWVSFLSLRHAAEIWGWPVTESWALPVIVDVAAVALTCASMGAGVRIRQLEAPEPEEPKFEEPPKPKRGRPAEPNSVRSRSKASKGEPVPSKPSNATSKRVERIFEEFGFDTSKWPSAKEISERLGVKPPTLSPALKEARAMADSVRDVPVSTGVVGDGDTQ